MDKNGLLGFTGERILLLLYYTEQVWAKKLIKGARSKTRGQKGTIWKHEINAEMWRTFLPLNEHVIQNQRICRSVHICPATQRISPTTPRKSSTISNLELQYIIKLSNMVTWWSWTHYKSIAQQIATNVFASSQVGRCFYSVCYPCTNLNNSREESNSS